MTSYRGSRFVLRLVLLQVLVGCQSVEQPFDDGKAWGTPELIETGPADALRAQIAIDGMGNAIAVWDQTDRETSRAEASDDIWSNRRDAGGQWGTAELRETHEPEDSVEAQIAVDGEGNAVVVFRQSTGEYFRSWAVRYTLSDGWENPECIHSDDPECIESIAAGDAGRIQVAIDSRGNAVAVWQQVTDADDERLSIWSNRFTRGAGWGNAGSVETSTHDLVAPQVAMDDNGNAIAVWERFDGVRSSIWSKRQTPTGEWVELQNVETDDSGNAFVPQVVADADGNAVAVWQQQTDGSRFDIWSNRYLASTRKWGDAERIEFEDVDDAETPQLAMDGNGDSQDSVWSNRYTVSGGWGRSREIEYNDEFRVQGPQVAMDFEGNAVAIWSQRGVVNFGVWSNRLE
jgi:uncharacterized protein YbdZ (MbtH family)